MKIKDKVNLKTLDHTKINIWRHGNYEMLVIKIPPSGNKATLFMVIGKSKEGTIYTIGTKPSDEYIGTYEKYEQLLKNLKSKLKIN